MNKLARSKFVLGVIAILASSACQQGDRPMPSGVGPSQLQVETKSPGIMKRYDSFYIGDIGVYSIEGDRLRRIDDREVRILADKFRAKLIRGLGDRHSPIPMAANNTAQINVNLSDVFSTYAAFQLLPGSIIPNALRGGASINATVIDSVSKQEVAHIRDMRQGSRQGYLSGFGKWDGVEKAFDEWAQMLSAAVRH